MVKPKILTIIVFNLSILLSFSFCSSEHEDKINSTQSSVHAENKNTDDDLNIDDILDIESQDYIEATSSEEDDFDLSFFDQDITGSITPVDELASGEEFQLADGVAFRIGEDEYNIDEFEIAYKQFNKLSPTKVSKKQFIPEYVGRKFMLKEALNHSFFRSTKGKALINNIKKQAVVEYYMLNEIEKKYNAPNKKELKEFEKYCENNFTEFSMLGLNKSILKSKKKLKTFYSNFNRLKRKNEILQQLKDKVSITYHPKKVMEKYIKNELNIKDATSKKNYKNYWILRINYSYMLENEKDDNSHFEVESEIDFSDEDDNSMDETNDDVVIESVIEPIDNLQKDNVKTDVDEQKSSIVDYFNQKNIDETYEEIVGYYNYNQETIEQTSSNDDNKSYDMDIEVELTEEDNEEEDANANDTIQPMPQDSEVKVEILNDVDFAKEKPSPPDKSDNKVILDDLDLTNKLQGLEEDDKKEIELFQLPTSPLGNILQDQNEKPKQSASKKVLSKKKKITYKSKSKVFNKKRKIKKRSHIIRNCKPNDNNIYVKYFYVRDLVYKINMLKQNNPKLFRLIKKSEALRQQLIQEFILSELIYLAYKNNQVPNYIRQFELSDEMFDNFILNYYVKNLFSKKRLRNYIQDYMSSNQLILNKKYF